MHFSKKTFFLTFALATVAGVTGYMSFTPSPLKDKNTMEFIDGETVTVAIKDTTIAAEVAAARDSRRKGLSGRTSLAEGEGMLFVFPRPQKVGIWMKDMHFAIDILWINAEQRVVHIVERAHPDSYPQIFKPEKLSQYVLELPAGTISRKDIQTGIEMEILTHN